jgi:hypothetical protein
MSNDPASHQELNLPPARMSATIIEFPLDRRRHASSTDPSSTIPWWDVGGWWDRGAHERPTREEIVAGEERGAVLIRCPVRQCGARIGERCIDPRHHLRLAHWGRLKQWVYRPALERAIFAALDELRTPARLEDEQ